MIDRVSEEEFYKLFNECVIKPGYIVECHFVNAGLTICKRGVVIRVADAGYNEPWVIQDENGSVHYISEPCTVSSINRPDPVTSTIPAES